MPNNTYSDERRELICIEAVQMLLHACRACVCVCGEAAAYWAGHFSSLNRARILRSFRHLARRRTRAANRARPTHKWPTSRNVNDIGSARGGGAGRVRGCVAALGVGVCCSPMHKHMFSIQTAAVAVAQRHDMA